MIRIEKHRDVVRFEMSHRRSRLLNFSVSAYLVRGVMVDCGFPALCSEFAQLLDSERLRGVVVTHQHEDHAGNVALIAERGIPIAADAGTLAEARSPKRVAFYRRFTWGEMRPLRHPVTPFFPDDLEIVHTAGHSGDHQVLWDPQEGTLFAGDLFLGVKVRVAHEREEPRRLVSSLRRMVELQPARLFDGHRGSIARPVQALEAKIAWMEETIGRIDGMIARGDDDDAIGRAVLGRRTFIDFVSGGEYSRLNFVRALRRTAPAQL